MRTSGAVHGGLRYSARDAPRLADRALVSSESTVLTTDAAAAEALPSTDVS